MKLVLLSVCVLLTLNLAPVRAADSDAAAAEKEIKARAEEFSAAWKKHDAALVAGFYATDGDLVTGQGQTYSGREKIEEVLRDGFDGGLKETTFKWTVEKVKLVGGIEQVGVEGLHIVAPPRDVGCRRYFFPNAQR